MIIWGRIWFKFEPHLSHVLYGYTPPYIIELFVKNKNVNSILDILS